MLLSIIGTAGRKDDYDKITKESWKITKNLVLNFVKKNNIKSVISGGAAFSDHIAVNLYNSKFVDKLILCLPSEFDLDNNFFKYKNYKDDGSISNYYHKRFSQKIYNNNFQSLLQISKSIQNGAEVVIGKGFFDRNNIVAEKSNILLAITFGCDNILKDGGTAHTTKIFIKKNGSENSYHLDLNKQEIFKNAVVKS